MRTSLRHRLEGRAELLEGAASRYRFLQAALSSVFWKDRLRRRAELVRRIAQEQAEVEQALEAALARAQAEGWPADDPWVRELFGLQGLTATVRALCAKRTRMDRGRPLAELLSALEAKLVGPRKVLPGQRWATAVQLLPEGLPEMAELRESADAVERLFRRPFENKGVLPLRPSEGRELENLWPRAEASLRVVWARVERCDPSLGLKRFLERRSRRAPVAAPANGAERLLRAAFWLDVARARLRAVADERFAPLAISDAELLPLMAWVCDHEENRDAPLPASAVGRQRAPVFELCHDVWTLPKPGGAMKRASSARPRSPALGREQQLRLRELARRADAAGPSEDADRLKDALWLLIRIRGAAEGSLPRAPAERTFEALVARAW